MERSEIFEKLNEIFRDVLDNDEIELQDSTTADDIEESSQYNLVEKLIPQVAGKEEEKVQGQNDEVKNAKASEIEPGYRHAVQTTGQQQPAEIDHIRGIKP